MLLQAIRDAQGHGRFDAAAGDQSAARRFLLSRAPPWRDDRNCVADFAGFDGEQVRVSAERLLRPLINAELAEPQAPLPARKRRCLAPADPCAKAKPALRVRTYAGKPLLTPAERRERNIASKRASRDRAAKARRQARALAAEQQGDVARSNDAAGADRAPRASPRVSIAA